MSSEDEWAHLRRATTARIALGRTGDSLPTFRVLEFALAHARARDAVHAKLDVEQLRAEMAALAPIAVQSLADTRAIYLQRPDLGRRLHRKAVRGSGRASMTRPWCWPMASRQRRCKHKARRSQSSSMLHPRGASRRLSSRSKPVSRWAMKSRMRLARSSLSC